MAHRPGYRVDLVALTDRHDAGDQPAPAEGIQNLAQDHALGETKTQKGPTMTVLIYVNEQAGR
jgi:hypothetical protein